jgi:hypothetical protein
MRQLPFKSVTVETKSIGRYRNITSVEEAGEFLAHDWPKAKGPAQLAVGIACRGAMENALPVDDARNAFIRAAKEADIYIGEIQPFSFGY